MNTVSSTKAFGSGKYAFQRVDDQMCPHCNSFIPIDEFYYHVDRCLSFKQSYTKGSKFHDNQNSDAPLQYSRHEGNYITFGSFKSSKRDNKDKELEDKEKEHGTGGIDRPVGEINDGVLTFGSRGGSKEDTNARARLSLPEYQIGIANPFGEHNSFLSCVVHGIYSMQRLRSYIIDEMSINEKDSKNSLLYQLQQVLGKFQSLHFGSKIGHITMKITELRKSLAELFQSRRKFLIDHPDDPVDAYFALINAIHSFQIKSNLNEVKDINCNMKCFAHKNLFVDLSRIDECECKGKAQRLYSYHNYIFDIPIDKILDMSMTTFPFEMNRSLKMKPNFTQGESRVPMSELKGKMFYYLKMIINSISVNCPEKGIRCSINKTNKIFSLNNIPIYLAFNLENSNEYLTKNLTKGDLLKIFLLIPKIFELGMIFAYNDQTNKCFYELLGGIALSTGSKEYTSFFKTNNPKGHSWTFTEDDHVENFNQWNEVLTYCVMSGQIPIMLFYRLSEKYNDVEREMNNDEITKLERGCRNLDNMGILMQNKFRTNENVIRGEISEQHELYVNIHNEKIRKEKGRTQSEEETGGVVTGDALRATSKSPVQKIRNDYNLPKQVQPQNKSIDKKEDERVGVNASQEKRKEIIDNNTEWKCEICGSLNKLPEYKCHKCGKKEIKILEKLMTFEIKRPAAAASSNVPNQAKQNISIKDIKEIKPEEQPRVKKDKEKEKDIQVRPYEKEKDINPNPNPNHNSPFPMKTSKSDFYKQQDLSDMCLCHKFEDEKIHSLFVNNICRICGRNRLEKSLKQVNVNSSNQLKRSDESLGGKIQGMGGVQGSKRIIAPSGAIIEKNQYTGKEYLEGNKPRNSNSNNSLVNEKKRQGEDKYYNFSKQKNKFDHIENDTKMNNYIKINEGNPQKKEISVVLREKIRDREIQGNPVRRDYNHANNNNVINQFNYAQMGVKNYIPKKVISIEANMNMNMNMNMNQPNKNKR